MKLILDKKKLGEVPRGGGSYQIKKTELDWLTVNIGKPDKLQSNTKTWSLSKFESTSTHWIMFVHNDFKNKIITFKLKFS